MIINHELFNKVTLFNYFKKFNTNITYGDRVHITNKTKGTKYKHIIFGKYS